MSLDIILARSEAEWPSTPEGLRPTKADLGGRPKDRPRTV